MNKRKLFPKMAKYLRFLVHELCEITSMPAPVILSRIQYMTHFKVQCKNRYIPHNIFMVTTLLVLSVLLCTLK